MTLSPQYPHNTYRKPDRNVGVSRIASAACILLITKRLHHNWVIKRACSRPISSYPFFNKPDPNAPLREASKGFMSKISMPCIFPKISNRSNPVACSRSVGMVPGAAPGGRRSASLLISALVCQFKSPKAEPAVVPANFFILPSLTPDVAGVGAASPGTS